MTETEMCPWPDRIGQFPSKPCTKLFTHPDVEESREQQWHRRPTDDLKKLRSFYFDLLDGLAENPKDMKRGGKNTRLLLWATFLQEISDFVGFRSMPQKNIIVTNSTVSTRLSMSWYPQYSNNSVECRGFLKKRDSPGSFYVQHIRCGISWKFLHVMWWQPIG